MRYCYNCNRVTIGDPYFCNFCGRSYNTKLCPRMHANPRNAQACSQCGSRDLSTPQPKVPLGASVLLFFLSLLPGFLLAVISITVVFLFLRELLQRPDILLALALLQIILTMLWWGWTQVPLFFRNAIYKMLKRKRDGDRQERR
jgi:RNA polymerase subunit RPABC4/transcription elongation factor Spt4